MKIVHIYKDFYPPSAGGIMGYIHDIADEAARRGNQVEVHAAGVRWSRAETMSSGVVVSRHREFGRLLSTPLSPALVRAGRRAAADVLHVHMPNPPGELGAMSNVHEMPLVVSFHCQLGRQRRLEPAYKPLRERLLQRAAVVLVASERLVEVPELATARSKVRLLPYGASPRLVSRCFSEPGHGHPLRILFVGRLVAYKGIDVLIRAVANIDDVTLTVVGEGPLRADLERLAVMLGTAKRIRFTGALDDDALREAYATHDVLVLPSRSRAEAFGLVMAEAMTNGMPVISTGLGTGTDWVNVDGETGFVVEPEDAEALCLALERMRSPSVRQELAKHALMRAQSLFSFDRHISELLRIYEEVAA